MFLFTNSIITKCVLFGQPVQLELSISSYSNGKPSEGNKGSSRKSVFIKTGDVKYSRHVLQFAHLEYYVLRCTVLCYLLY